MQGDEEIWQRHARPQEGGPVPEYPGVPQL